MTKPRASLMPAWKACTCFDSKEEVGEPAIRGTLQHDHLTRILKKTHTGDMTDLEAAEAEGVIWAAAYIEDWCEKLDFPIESEVEMSYFADPVNDFEPMFTMHQDAICSSNLFDYKSGDYHDYEAQMYAYALGMFQRDPSLQNVLCHILYGRTKVATKFFIQRVVAEGAITRILTERANPDKKPKACSFCSWCVHAPVCSELHGIAMTVAENRPEYKLETFKTSEIGKPEEMAKALRMARALKTWCESVEHHAKEMAIKNGEYIPGFVPSKKSGNRFITDVPKAVELSGLEPLEFLKCCTPKIGELEKKLGKKPMAEKLNTVIDRGADVYFLSEEKVEPKDAVEPEPVPAAAAAALDTDF